MYTVYINYFYYTLFFILNQE